MRGQVKNLVSKNAPRMEQVGNGWVLRHNFGEPNENGMCICDEVQFIQGRKPKMEVVKSIVEQANGIFEPAQYGY